MKIDSNITSNYNTYKLNNATSLPGKETIYDTKDKDYSNDTIIEISEEGYAKYIDSTRINKGKGFNSVDPEDMGIRVMGYYEEFNEALETSKGIVDSVFKMTEKYYELLDRINEKYKDSDQLGWRIRGLNNSYNDLIDNAAYVLATVTGMAVSGKTQIITRDYTYTREYNNENEYVKKGITEKDLYNDFLNMFNNITNYYSGNKYSFKGISALDINKNSKYLKIEDFYDLEDLYNPEES